MTFFITSIILFVQDVDKLKKFYIDYFQLEVAEEIKAEWVLLNAGICKIGLHKAGPGHLASPAKKLEENSNTKIVFETGEDIFKLREQLTANQVKIKEVKTFNNYDYWLCDGEDPEGNVFQIKQKKMKADV